MSEPSLPLRIVRRWFMSNASWTRSPKDLVYRLSVDRDPAPLSYKQGMMGFLFSKLANFVREFQRLGKILELEDPFQTLDTIHFFDLPFRNLRNQHIDLTIRHGRLACAA